MVYRSEEKSPFLWYLKINWNKSAVFCNNTDATVIEDYQNRMKIW